jgi:hypothetical protein
LLISCLFLGWNPKCSRGFQFCSFFRGVLSLFSSSCRLLLWSLEGWSEMSTDLIVGQLTNSVPVYSNCYGLESSWDKANLYYILCCFTFQRQLWVVYVLCKIGVRNSGLLFILRKKPSVLKALLLNSTVALLVPHKQCTENSGVMMQQSRAVLHSYSLFCKKSEDQLPKSIASCNLLARSTSNVLHKSRRHLHLQGSFHGYNCELVWLI